MPSVECYSASTRDKGRAVPALVRSRRGACLREGEPAIELRVARPSFSSESPRSGGRIQVISYQYISRPVIQSEQGCEWRDDCNARLGRPTAAGEGSRMRTGDRATRSSIAGATCARC